MPSRSTVVVALAALLLIGLVACQSFGVVPSVAVAPTAVAPARATTPEAKPFDAGTVVAAAKAQGREIVWGAVANCTCGDYIGTGNVTNAVDNARIGATVQDATVTATAVYFYVTYDPATATRERVVAAVVAGGGRIKPGPPTSTSD